MMTGNVASFIEVSRHASMPPGRSHHIFSPFDWFAVHGLNYLSQVFAKGFLRYIQEAEVTSQPS